MRAQTAVNGEEPFDFGDDVVERARLVPRRRFPRVAVHRVAHPHHRVLRRGHLGHDGREPLLDQACPHPCHQGQASGFAVRVQMLQQRQDVIRMGVGAHLDPDGVGDPAQEVDMGPVGLPSALPRPEEMPGRAIELTGHRVRPRQCALVVQRQRFMRNEELHTAELLRVGSAGPHECQRPVDVRGEPVVTLSCGREAHEVPVPGVDLPQVGAAVLHERTDQVQRRAARAVHPQQSLRVRAPPDRFEGKRVDGVAVVRGQLHATPALDRFAARLEVLPGHPAHLDHG